MKILFSAAFCLLHFVASSQVFNFENEWLDSRGSFNEEWIESNSIKSIQLRVSEKKDGQKFQKETAYIEYVFGKNGKLNQSHKYIPIHKGMDTLSFSFQYDHKGQLLLREESDSRFHFNYYFIYSDNELGKEIKVNQLNGDTSYLRFFKLNIAENQRHYTFYNSIKKPFLIVQEKYNEHNLLLSKRTSYSRNSNYRKLEFIYEGKKLKQKELSRYFGHKKSIKSEFFYQGNFLDEILIKKDGILTKKFAITYSLNGFPKEIIERDVLNQKVKIYRLSYSNQN